MYVLNVEMHYRQNWSVTGGITVFRGTEPYTCWRIGISSSSVSSTGSEGGRMSGAGRHACHARHGLISTGGRRMKRYSP